MYIKAEYLPSVLNTVLDRKSRKNHQPNVFWVLSQLLGSLTIDLFASCLWHQITQCIAWHSDAYIQEIDAMIQIWNMGLPSAFPPCIMISRRLLKIKWECVLLPILIAPVWSTQPWYPEARCWGTSATTTEKRNSGKPKKYFLPSDGGEPIDPRGLFDFRKTLLCERFSKNESHIIKKYRRKDTLSNYESSWRKCTIRCLEWKNDPFQTPVKDTIE